MDIYNQMDQITKDQVTKNTSIIFQKILQTPDNSTNTNIVCITHQSVPEDHVSAGKVISY